MSDSGQLIVRARSTQSLVIDRLAGGSFHQIRAAQSHKRGTINHHDNIGERRQICAPGNARPHHRGYLRNLQVAPHYGVVIKNSRGAVLARENSALKRKIHARGIDQVDDWNM